MFSVLSFTTLLHLLKDAATTIAFLLLLIFILTVKVSPLETFAVYGS